MGKALIIKGADFSGAAIEKPFIPLKGVKSLTTTQYLKSPFNFNGNSRIVVTFSYTIDVIEPTAVSFGFMQPFRLQASAWYNSDRYKFGLWWRNDGGPYIISDTKPVINRIYTLDMCCRKVFFKSVEDGIIPLADDSTLQIPTISHTYYINAPYSSKDVVSDANAGSIIYSFKQYSDLEDDNSLIVDAIPAIEKATNKVGLFDRVSETFIFSEDNTDLEPVYFD